METEQTAQSITVLMRDHIRVIQTLTKGKIMETKLKFTEETFAELYEALEAFVNHDHRFMSNWLLDQIRKGRQLLKKARGEK